MTNPNTTKAGERTQWRKGQYKITTNPNGPLEDQTDMKTGYIFKNVFGIEQGHWSVTHIPTGLKMPGYFMTMRNAKSFVSVIAPLTDWPTLTVENSTERFTPIKTQILNAVQQYAI